MVKKDRLISLTQKVISINSENPPGNELELSRFIQRYMESLGLYVQIHEFAKDRPNVVAIYKGSLPRKDAQKNAIMITPHIDTVPFGRGWRYHPLSGHISKGKIYGRGASDDKGNLAACMELMRSLVEDKIKLRKDVIMAATVDEETGSCYGLIPLLKKMKVKPAFALVLDSDEFDTIVAQKGLIHVRVLIFGKKAHGAYNWRGINAIELAAKVISRLKRIRFKYDRHRLLRAPTINIGTIHGGDKVNMVADFCEFSVDLRFLPGMDYKEILDKLKSTIRTVTDKFKLEIDNIQAPYEITRDNLYVRCYINTAKRMGITPQIKGSEGATVITFFKKYGIPAFATGFGAHGTAHTENEYIFIDSLYKGTLLLERFVKEYDAL